MGLVLGGALTEYLSWRWTLYVNLIFAAVAFTGGALLLKRQPSSGRPRLDIPGVLLVSGGMFCLVYGFSNAATHSWHAPSTYGFIAAGVALLAAFAAWQGRAAHPLLPPRVVLDRNRGGAYLAMLIAGAGHVRDLLVPDLLHAADAGLLAARHRRRVPADGRRRSWWPPTCPTIVLMPRLGPKPLVAAGMLAAARAAWSGWPGSAPHTGYAPAVLGPLIVAGIGMGLVIAPSINTGTFGVAPQDAGVASATLNAGQQLGGSIGTSLLNTIFASAVAAYLTAHLAGGPDHRPPGPDRAGAGARLRHRVLVAAGIFAGGAIIGAALLRPGPLVRTSTPSRAHGGVTTAEAEAGPVHPA